AGERSPGRATAIQQGPVAGEPGGWKPRAQSPDRALRRQLRGSELEERAHPLRAAPDRRPRGGETAQGRRAPDFPETDLLVQVRVGQLVDEHLAPVTVTRPERSPAEENLPAIPVVEPSRPLVLLQRPSVGVEVLRRVAQPERQQPCLQLPAL